MAVTILWKTHLSALVGCRVFHRLLTTIWKMLILNVVKSSNNVFLLEVYLKDLAKRIFHSHLKNTIILKSKEVFFTIFTVTVATIINLLRIKNIKGGKRKSGLCIFINIGHFYFVKCNDISILS